MYDNNPTGNANNQQGDNTPPPMFNTPISNDSPATGLLPQDGSGQSQPSGDEQFTPAQYAVHDSSSAPSQPDDLVNPASSDAGSDDELLTIKQQALQQLTPLVGHLDQTPKEEFRTTMMMIQATDNQELIKKAFEAAQKIEDDKERAQAFLDIINEINYFTQHHQE